MHSSPVGTEFELPELASRWRRADAGEAGVFVQQNVAIEVPSQTFIFGRVENADEAMAARDIEERAGNGDGKRNGVDGTNIGDDVDSTRVEVAQLAEQSQRMYYNRRLNSKL